jgi:hypothetical protein
LKREQEGMMKADIELVARNNLMEKEKDDIVKNLIVNDFLLPAYSSWKDYDSKTKKYEYIKCNWDFKIEKSVDNNGFYRTTKNIVLNNNLLTEKQMNELQNISLKKGGIVTLNDYNYNNDNPRTLEE